MEFKIPFRLPGLNEFMKACKGNKNHAAAVKRCTERDIALCVRGRVTEPVHVTFVWLEPNRKRDKDNVAFAKNSFWTRCKRRVYCQTTITVR